MGYTLPLACFIVKVLSNCTPVKPALEKLRLAVYIRGALAESVVVRSSETNTKRLFAAS